MEMRRNYSAEFDDFLGRMKLCCFSRSHSIHEEIFSVGSLQKMHHDTSSKMVEKLFVAMETVFREHPLCADATVENINCTLEVTLPHKFMWLNGTQTKIVSEDAYYLANIVPKSYFLLRKVHMKKHVKSKSKFVQKTKSG